MGGTNSTRTRRSVETNDSETEPTRPSNNKVEPDELIRLMNNNTDVVIQYYNSNREFIEKYIVDNFWEEDVERWLTGIRERSPAENLQVRQIDFLKPKNGKEHNTSLYENTSLIVRRATTFDLDIQFGNRNYDAKRDDLTIVFSVGLNPSEASGTKFVCPVVENAGKKTAWNCSVVKAADKKLSARVNVPANAIVARYSVALEIVSGTSDGRARSVHTHKDNSIIVLFNPFDKDDSVYMEDKEEREEYVINDNGVIFRGSYWRIGPKTWDYAQFDAGVLDNVLQMIRNDVRHLAQPVKSWKKCNDPVYLSRVLSSMVNCNDDKGVLWGRWDGKYEDGRSPGYWSDSARILKEWADSGMKPVKYGQCWVFAGILTTALRAIGIPARCISNFASAHDTNANVTVDNYYDADTGDKMDETSDSVWNYHVWNEAFFKRPDLPEGYDGWQVVDATPQEVSASLVDSRLASLFQCGPAPVKAIKEGNIHIGYDSNFIFGEVNADKVNWIVKGGKVRDGPEILKRDIGRNISTKAVGSNSRSDVTNMYKFAEGTEEERESFLKAYGKGTMDHSTFGIRDGGPVIKPKFEIEIIQANEDFVVGSKVTSTIKVKNISASATEASIKVAGSTKRHIGTMYAMLKKEIRTEKIQPNEAVEFTFEINESEYIRSIVDNKVINIRVIATDTDDGNTRVRELDIALNMPDCITTTAPTTVPRNSTTKFDVIFENKFPITLTNSVFEIYFRGNQLDDLKFIVEQPIPPGQTYTVKDVAVLPSSNWGRVYATVEFDCAEVTNLQHGFRMRVL